MKKFSIRAGVLTALLAACASAVAQTPHDEAFDLRAFAEMISGETDEVRSGVSEASAVLASLDGKPTAAHLLQEGKASALWTGRIFMARGRPLDERVSSLAVSADETAPPAGWSREESKLVHNESGLACPAEFNLGDKNKKRPLKLIGISQYDERGRDVSCNYSVEGAVSITLYASFYPDMTVEDHAAGAVAAMRQNFTIRGVLPVTIAEITRKNEDGEEIALPTPLAGGFDVGEINGVPYKTSIWIAKAHGWHVKARATYAQNDIVAEVIAALLFATNYSRIDMKNLADPTTAGADV